MLVTVSCDGLDVKSPECLQKAQGFLLHFPMVLPSWNPSLELSRLWGCTSLKFWRAVHGLAGVSLGSLCMTAEPKHPQEKVSTPWRGGAGAGFRWWAGMWAEWCENHQGALLPVLCRDWDREGRATVTAQLDADGLHECECWPLACPITSSSLWIPHLRSPGSDKKCPWRMSTVTEAA